jgi:hypothetical protein
MGSYYTVNIGALNESNARAAGLVNEAGDHSGRIRVVQARSGGAVPECEAGGRWTAVHSRYDPVKEAERFVAEAETKGFNLFIVFGFGFGYHVEALLAAAPRDAVVLVMEKSPGMLRTAMEHRALEHLFRDDRLQVVVGPRESDIGDTLRGKSTYRVAFLTHRGSHQTDPHYYNNLQRLARSYLSAKEVNIATLAKFEKAWAANVARNIAQHLAYPGAAVFYGAFSNVPAIVVAAGPSLLQSIDFIRKSTEKAVIIAVDTSYMILRKHGIEPHFCMSVDPQAVNARYFEGDRGGRTVLVADPTVHPSSFRLFHGRKVITGTAFKMMKWIEEITGERGELAYGGSVSTNAYDFAKRLGASPVVLVGQDLAFTGGLAHARGSYLDEQVFLRVNRFYSPLMFNRYQLTALPPIFVEGIRSPRVPTNQKMMIFHEWFGKRRDTELVNATHDGARLSGIRHEAAEDIGFADPGFGIFDRIGGLYERALPAIAWKDEARRKLLERCGGVRDELKALVELLERTVVHSKGLLDIMNAGEKDQGKIHYIIKKLAEADREIESMNALRDMVGFTIQRVIQTITEGYEIDEDDARLSQEQQVAKRSHYLYEGLLEGCRFNMKIVGVMERLLSEYSDQ